MDEWLERLLDETEPAREWEPAFQAGQCLVETRLGPLRRFYLRPPGFRPRFYHRLHPLPVRLWRLEYGKTLFQGLCRLRLRAKIRYQVTLAYVERHPESLADPDAHVRTALEPLVMDLLDHRLHRLESGNWIDTGLTGAGREIEEAVNRLLARHHLRCRTLCDLEPAFAEPEDAEILLFREEIYRAIEERRRALRQRRFQERRRCQQERERHEAELARLRREAECEREIAEGRHRKRLLEIRRRYRAEVEEMEARFREETPRQQARSEFVEPDRRDGHEGVGREASAAVASTGRHPEREDESDRAVPALPEAPGLDAARALRDGRLPLAALDPGLRAPLDRHSAGTELGEAPLAVPGGWLRRLLQRLLFLLLGAR